MIRVIGSGILIQSGKDYMKTPEAARQLEAMKKLMDKVRMKKPTKQQIIDETDEQILNEWVAVFCMGWRRENGNAFFGTGWHDDDDNYMAHFSAFNPCQDKAQAFDLMVKHGCRVYIDDYTYVYSYSDYYIYDDISPQIAIVKASLLSVIGD